MTSESLLGCSPVWQSLADFGRAKALVEHNQASDVLFNYVMEKAKIALAGFSLDVSHSHRGREQSSALQESCCLRGSGHCALSGTFHKLHKLLAAFGAWGSGSAGVAALSSASPSVQMGLEQVIPLSAMDAWVGWPGHRT